MKNSKTLIILFFVLAGVIIGSLVGQLCQGVAFLSWLGYARTIGINAGNPVVIDLAVVKVAFGFEMGISVAQILFILLFLLLGRRYYKGK